MEIKCPVFLCANKIDLPHKVRRSTVVGWAQSHGCIPFFTSALNGDGIEEMFGQAARQVSNLIMCNEKQIPLDSRKPEKGECCSVL
jgi:GTPase SAR1 family protein